MAQNRHYFPFYTNDWLSSGRVIMLMHTNPKAVAGYIFLLCEIWNSETLSIPNNNKKLQVLSRLGTKWNKCSEDVLQFFYEENGQLFNEKMNKIAQEKKPSYVKDIYMRTLQENFSWTPKKITITSN